MRGTAIENRDAFEADAIDQARGFELCLEVDFGGKQRGRPEAHELAEDVAERKAVEKAQRVNEALVAQILLHLALDGIEAGEDVAVGVDDAFGRGRGAGGEDDLEGRVEGDGWIDGEERVGGQGTGEVVEGEVRDFGGEGRQRRGTSARTSLGATSAMTRAAKSGEPAASRGTASTPRRRQPKKAATHSAEFSPQSTTRSPGAMPRRASSAENLPARVAKSP